MKLLVYRTHPCAGERIPKPTAWEVGFLLLSPWREIEADFQAEFLKGFPRKVCVDIPFKTGRFWAVTISVRSSRGKGVFGTHVDELFLVPL